MGFLSWLFGEQTTATIQDGQEMIDDGQWEPQQEWVVPNYEMVPAPQRQPIRIRVGRRQLEPERQPEPIGRCRVVYGWYQDNAPAQNQYYESQEPTCVPGICSPYYQVGKEYPTSSGGTRVWTQQDEDACYWSYMADCAAQHRDI